MRWLLLLLTLSCRPAIPEEAELLSLEELGWAQSIFDEWEARGLTVAKHCGAHRIRIVRDGGTAFQHWCGVPERQDDQTCADGTERCAMSCYMLGRPMGRWTRRNSRAVPVIAVAAWTDRDVARYLVLHETMHYVKECNGSSQGDPLHLDAEAWDYEMGVLETVARRLQEGTES